MLSQRIANIAFAGLVLLACAYFGWEAESFETSGLLASSGLPSKFFPQLMLCVMAICAVIVGYGYIKRDSSSVDDGEMVFNEPEDARRVLLMLAVCVGSYAIWKNYGFIGMAILIGPLSLLAMGVRNLAIYAVVWCLTAFIYLIFTQVLGIQLV